MAQEVYVDLYFLVNFSMDLLCLMITAALLHRRLPKWRPFLAAGFGGGYAVVSLLLGFRGGLGFLGDVLAAIVICALGMYCRKTSFFSLLKWTGVYALTSMILGGVMTALYACLNRLNLPLESLQGDDLSVWTFALLTAVAGVATLRGGRLLGLSQKTKNVTVVATLFGKEVTLRAMVDSGNLLRDPVSGKSVIVVETEAVAHILPPSLARAYRTGDFHDWLSSYETAKTVRAIPTQTAMGGSILFAIVPEALTVTEKGKPYPANYLIAPAPLGKTDGNFDAVISLD